MKSSLFMFLLLVLVLIGCVALIGGTRWGIGASPDSVYYIGAARNMLQGHGYSLPAADGSNTPLTHLPPLYSTLLAIVAISGVDVLFAARWVNVILFGANIFLVGWMISQWAGSGERWIALAGALLFTSSVVMLEIHLMAWSESLFIFLGLLSLIILGRYLTTQRMGQLVGAAILASLTLLTRFAGAAFILTGAIAILLLVPAKPARRLREALIFTVISSAPILLWLLSNITATGTAANREFAFHPIGKLQISQALTTLASWFFVPDTARTWVKASIVGLAFLAICAVVYYALIQGKVNRSRSIASRLETVPAEVKLLLVFLLVYPLTLVFSLTFFDANTPLDRRILSPVFVVGLILSCYALIEANKLLGKHGFIKWALLILLVVFCSTYLVTGGERLQQSYKAGNGFNSVVWQQSPMLESLRNAPDGTVIYSNAPDGIFLQTGRPAQGLPRKFDVMVQRPNPDYPAHMQAMLESIEKGGVLVYFKGLDWPNLPNERELAGELSLRVLGQYADGTIYGALQR